MMLRNALYRSFLLIVLGVITTAKTVTAADSTTPDITTATVSTATGEVAPATCGQCLPIGPMMNAFDGLYLVTRFWTIVDPSQTSDLDVIHEFETGFAPLVQSMPGFIQYTAAQTGSNSTVFFQNLFDTEAHASAAQQAASDFVSTNEVLTDGAIVPYYFTEYIVAYENTNGVDCVNTSNEGKYLSTRLYERAEADVNMTTADFITMVTSSNTTKALLTSPGFVDFKASVANDGIRVFMSNVFETEDGALDANDMGLANNTTMTALAATTGKIAFDYLCTTTPTTEEDTTTSSSSSMSHVVSPTITSLLILVLMFHR